MLAALLYRHLMSGSTRNREPGRRRNCGVPRRADNEDQTGRSALHACYHQQRPDVILGLITTRPVDPLSPTDCEIRSWEAAGLHAPSCFRLYIVTLLHRDVRVVGRLADNDWQAVRHCVQAGMVGS